MKTLKEVYTELTNPNSVKMWKSLKNVMSAAGSEVLSMNDLISVSQADKPVAVRLTKKLPRRRFKRS